MSGLSSTATRGLKPPLTIPEGIAVPVNGSSVNVGGLSVNKSTSGLTDVLNVSSSGVLEFAIIGAGTALTASEFKITIDGVVVYDRTGAISTNNSYMPVGFFDLTESGSLAQIIFDASCLIEYASDDANSAFVHYKYYLT